MTNHLYFHMPMFLLQMNQWLYSYSKKIDKPQTHAFVLFVDALQLAAQLATGFCKFFWYKIVIKND